MLLHLVRHGPPVIEPGEPASSWLLDEAATAELGRLRTFLDRNVGTASWHSSDEPKALATAHALTDGDIEVEPELREAIRADWFPRREQLQAAVRQAFDAPDRAARPGWEPLDQTRQRIGGTVARILARSPGNVVLVGHGTAWTLLVSDMTGRPPDLAAWHRLRMPDLCTLDPGTGSITRRWGRLVGASALESWRCCAPRTMSLSWSSRSCPSTRSRPTTATTR